MFCCGSNSAINTSAHIFPEPTALNNHPNAQQPIPRLATARLDRANHLPILVSARSADDNMPTIATAVNLEAYSKVQELKTIYDCRVLDYTKSLRSLRERSPFCSTPLSLHHLDDGRSEVIESVTELFKARLELLNEALGLLERGIDLPKDTQDLIVNSLEDQKQIYNDALNKVAVVEQNYLDEISIWKKREEDINQSTSDKVRAAHTQLYLQKMTCRQHCKTWTFGVFYSMCNLQAARIQLNLNSKQTTSSTANASSGSSQPISPPDENTAVVTEINEVEKEINRILNPDENSTSETFEFLNYVNSEDGSVTTDARIADLKRRSTELFDKFNRLERKSELICDNVFR